MKSQLLHCDVAAYQEIVKLKPLVLSRVGIEFYYIHAEIYTLKSRRVNFRSQTDVNQSNVAYRFSHM